MKKAMSYAKEFFHRADIFLLVMGLIVLASLIALIVAGRRRRAGKDDEN